MTPHKISILRGTNLEALKLLQSSYFRKVKMIYIDPPYNTGNDFVYEDDFADPLNRYREITQQTTKSNPETMGRFHTNWLNMMYSRLRMAANLLRDDGVIFISIDDNEVHNSHKLCDEIFGEENFVCQFTWQKNFAPKNDNKYISVSQEYIIHYAKSKDMYNRNLLPREEKHNKNYSNPDNDTRGLWTSGSMLATTFSESGVFEIHSPTGNISVPPSGRCWRYSKTKVDELIKENKIWFGNDGNNLPRVKRFLSEMPDGVVPQTLLKYEDVGSGQNGTLDFRKTFDNTQMFDFPKPINLIKRFIQIATTSDDIILDFFSGSATTAHAVMQLNAEDGGKRRFIIVQLPEQTSEKSEAYKAGYKNIREIGKERIRRAGKKIEDEASLTSQNLDTGFRVFKLDSSNLQIWDDSPVSREYERSKDLEDTANRLPNLMRVIDEECFLSRHTVLEILFKSGKTIDFINNPQKFIKMFTEILRNVQSKMEIDGISYKRLSGEEYYLQEIFDSEELIAYLDKNAISVDHSLYDHLIYDSSTVERPFAVDLDNDPDVNMFFKIPDKFKIETPIGKYNPDWAVYVDKDGMEKLYFVLETKGVSGFLGMDKITTPEGQKIRCGEKHFKALDSGVMFSKSPVKNWMEFKKEI